VLRQTPSGSVVRAPVPERADQLPLSVRDLRIALGGRSVLDGVDLDVPAGELLAVLGANGSGKSTTLRCIVGLLQPDHGSVMVCGRELIGLDRAQLRLERSRVAMIFQQGHLVRRRSALDNVCAGALGRLALSRSLSPWTFPRGLREEAMRCLDLVGLADRAADRVSRLSGGQQQRVAIARALCQRPDVLLADEPVAALDPAAAEQVLSLLAGLAHEQRLAVVAVLHQPGLALRHADRIIGLQAGRVQLDAPGAALSQRRLEALYPSTPALEPAR
jgi:phosphonate transport system ATP-binding protein